MQQDLTESGPKTPTCEYASVCPFYNDKMAFMPAKSAEMKDHYCFHSPGECARVKIARESGWNAVPFQKFPDGYYRSGIAPKVEPVKSEKINPVGIVQQTPANTVSGSDNCELIATCAFFGEKLPTMPATTNFLKARYCQRDYTNCARYLVRQSLGKEKVPLDLYPDDAVRAKSIISREKG